jgi:hypothetical protein
MKSDLSKVQSASEITRPGITPQTLIAAGVRRVTEAEAKDLIGFAASGLAIPYHNKDGSALIVNRKPFFRIRLDQPKGSAKYLSPRDSGAQIYIPPSLTAAPVLYITEGEFKALSLAEEGRRSRWNHLRDERRAAFACFGRDR